MVKKTKTGASTDVGVLLELSEYHSLPKEILKYMQMLVVNNIIHIMSIEAGYFSFGVLYVFNLEK